VTRIVITGGPRTGKTTLSESLGDRCGHNNIRHTDDLIGKLDWSAASLEVSRWFDEPGPWIIEGVAVSRALRKWREAHPGEPPPVDQVIYLHTPYEALSKGQATMAKGVETVHAEIEPWLRQYGISAAHTCVYCGQPFDRPGLPGYDCASDHDHTLTAHQERAARMGGETPT
jgi:hypothetical protein